MVFKYLLLFLFVAASLLAQPWGKDADLCTFHKHIETKTCSTPMFGAFSELLISFHQTVISPSDGPRSHFFPSSSQYTLEAMRTHGFFKGFTMGCDRLMRENSEEWVYPKQIHARATLKHDPVPVLN